jgi:DNA polymerase-1
MSGPLLAVDAPYLLYRAFFALPESIRGVEDRPVGALLGTVSSLLRVIETVSPRAVVVCFGAESAAYRVALYPPYHAQRPPMPQTLAWQFAAAPELLAAFGWLTEDAGELEADDLLGAYAAAEQAAGGHALLLTGDRDIYQCVSPQATVLYLKGGQEGFAAVDTHEVERRYGVAPHQVPDFIALRGDPSDGLPGAPGVGAKTAAALLGQSGSLVALLDAVGTTAAPRDAPDVRPRIAASLREHADDLRTFKEIATLRPVSAQRPDDKPSDRAAGAVAAARFGLRQLEARLRR